MSAGSVGYAIAAAGCLAVASAVQHQAATGEQGYRSGIHLLWRLARSRRWMIGMAAAAGEVLHAAALNGGALAVVQPLLVLSLAMALPGRLCARPGRGDPLRAGRRRAEGRRSHRAARPGRCPRGLAVVDSGHARPGGHRRVRGDPGPAPREEGCYGCGARERCLVPAVTSPCRVTICRPSACAVHSCSLNRWILRRRPECQRGRLPPANYPAVGGMSISRLPGGQDRKVVVKASLLEARSGGVPAFAGGGELRWIM